MIVLGRNTYASRKTGETLTPISILEGEVLCRRPDGSFTTTSADDLYDFEPEESLAIDEHWARRANYLNECRIRGIRP